MNIDFDNILEHVVSMDNFQLGWRFADIKYDQLPSQHLELLKPFDKEASTFLSNYIDNSDLHNDIPFKKDFFQTIRSIGVWPIEVFKCGAVLDKQLP